MNRWSKWRKKKKKNTENAATTTHNKKAPKMVKTITTTGIFFLYRFKRGNSSHDPPTHSKTTTATASLITQPMPAITVSSTSTTLYIHSTGSGTCFFFLWYHLTTTSHIKPINHQQSATNTNIIYVHIERMQTKEEPTQKKNSWTRTQQQLSTRTKTN